MEDTLNVRSDGMGEWSYDVVLPMLRRTFTRTRILTDAGRAPDLVVRGPFSRLETLDPYSCPYITWSGESYRTPHRSHSPILELNTAYFPEAEHSVYLPHLIMEIPRTARPDPNPAKRWCCAFAFSNRVREREELFLQMRVKEPTCYAFGNSCMTRDNPFTLGASQRKRNAEAFGEFGFVVAMENKVAPGYLTEKIGAAFCAGSVPIYWGDSAAVSDFFNPEAFLDVGDYANPRAAALAAVEIWKDPQKLQRFLDAPITRNTVLADYEAVRTEYRPWQKPFVDRLRDAFPDYS